MTTYVGRPLKRFEDPRLLTGQGAFVDDLRLPGMLHAVVLRSPPPTNPLRLKGIGELPTVACAVAITNAALDALSGTSVRHLDAPLVAEKVWCALQERAS
jgi:CO/xanthine dehydrogenase Mo-binding subunit